MANDELFSTGWSLQGLLKHGLEAEIGWQEELGMPLLGRMVLHLFVKCGLHARH